VQTDETGLTEPPQPNSVAQPRAALPPSPGMAAGIARGAAIIAGLSALSRALGLIRTLVFSQTVGAGCLGTAYVTANQVPNLIYELALGGALASAMVPILARSAQHSATDPEARQRVERISSALLTWAVIILVPLTALIAALAGPIASLLIPANPNAACARADMVHVAANMIVAFAPQILLYGLSVVLFGLLQAYRRFTGMTLAPVIGNVVIISSYLAFVPLDKGLPMARTPLAAELVLSIGTTMNIGMLVIVSLPPTWRLHLKLRPALRLPAGVMRQAGGLALVGVLEFLASDLSSVVTIALANGHGDTGTLVLSNYASLVYYAVASVLAMSIVTSAFPVLSASDGDAFDRTCAGSTRAVMLMSWLGTAVMAGIALPAARILATQPGQSGQLVQGFVLIAPGVAGFAVITNISRVLFALGRLKVAAAGLVAGPLLQMALSAVLVSLAPPRLVVGALSLATTVAMLVTAVPMVFATRRIRGEAATAGIGHATIASLAAAAAGAVAAVAAAMSLPAGGKLLDAVSGAVATAAAVAAFGVVAYLLDKGDLRMAFQPLRRFSGFRWPRRQRHQG
jgi:putative peptidoglycan lipid II flippase